MVVVQIQAEFPKNSEQIEHLDCEDPVNFRYRLSLIKRMTPSLVLSQKVSIRKHFDLEIY